MPNLSKKNSTRPHLRGFARLRSTTLCLGLTAILAACGGADPASAPSASATAPSQVQNECASNQDSWLSAWGVTRAVGTSLSFGSQEAPKETTLRNIARVSVEGQKIRLRLINLSDQPLVIGAASIAKRSGTIGANLIPETSIPVTFNCGATGVTIPAGTESLYSDAIEFAVTPEDHLAVSFYVPEQNGSAEYGATWHESYKLPADAGNLVDDNSGAGYELIDSSPIANPAPVPLLCNGCLVFALRDIEVITDQAKSNWVFLGSSSFHGFNTTQNAFTRVSDLIAERLNQEFSADMRVAVVNRGIGGDTLLNAVDTRFDRDVLDTKGISAVVAWVTNDLGDRDADSIIGTYEELIERAHAKGVKVFCPTWLPAAQSTQANLNGERAKLNDWILNSGRCDGVVDWATPVEAPGGLTYLPQYNSGDFIHSNDAGHALWSEITPLGEWLNITAN